MVIAVFTELRRRIDKENLNKIENIPKCQTKVTQLRNTVTEMKYNNGAQQ